MDIMLGTIETASATEFEAIRAQIDSLYSTLQGALVNEAMKRTSGVKAHAANLLGINRTTLVERLKRHRVARKPVAYVGLS